MSKEIINITWQELPIMIAMAQKLKFIYACCTINIKVSCVVHLPRRISRPADILPTVASMYSFDAQCTNSLVSLRQRYALIVRTNLNTIENPRNGNGRIALHDSTLNNRHFSVICRPITKREWQDLWYNWKGSTSWGHFLSIMRLSGNTIFMNKITIIGLCNISSLIHSTWQ